MSGRKSRSSSGGMREPARERPSSASPERRTSRKLPRLKSQLNIADVSPEDLRLVSETSFECIECVESIIEKANSIHAPPELRDLSLTLATLERQLFNYISDHLLRSRKLIRKPGQSTGSLSSLGRRLGDKKETRRERRTLQAALRRALERLDDGHIPLLCGGVASLFHNLRGALLETKASVNALNSIFYTTTYDSLISILSALLAAAGVWRATSWLSLSLQILTRTRPARWNGPMSTPLGIQLHVAGGGWLGWFVRMWRRLSYMLIRAPPRVKGALSLLVGGYLVHWYTKSRTMARVERCHRQLLLLQRIMGCVIFALDEARFRRACSYVELIAYPSQRLDQKCPTTMPAARLLVESVAYPCHPYIHQYTHGRHYLLKRALDVLYSSMGVAWRLGGGNTWLSLGFTQMALPYFLTHPRRAASYAAGVRQVMSPAFFRFICWAASNPISRWATAALVFRHYKTRVIFYLEHSKRPVFVFQKSGVAPSLAPAARATASSWATLPFGLSARGGGARAQPKPTPAAGPAAAAAAAPERPVALPEGGPVLFYIHGGGFCVNLMTPDLPFISACGDAAPRVPIVCREYACAPEEAFPYALDEICATYEWVRAGGLGFTPSRVVVAGESAGGNYACALCVRYVAAHHPRLAEHAGALETEELRRRHGLKPAPAIRAPMPDHVFIGYPALNLGASPSPSRALHKGDPLLPSAAGKLAKAYFRHETDGLFNPQVSPIFASDQVLAHFPPTDIMSGGMDLLLDDAVDFHIRLRRSGVPGRFKIFRTLPHGFFGLDQLLPEAHEAKKVAVSWIQSALFRVHSPTTFHPLSPHSDSSDTAGSHSHNNGSAKVSFQKGESKEASKEEGG